MSQIIVEQQFHYTAKMSSEKHFPNAIYANRNAKLLPAPGSKALITHKIFTVAKIFINLAPEFVKNYHKSLCDLNMC